MKKQWQGESKIKRDRKLEAARNENKTAIRQNDVVLCRNIGIQNEKSPVLGLDTKYERIILTKCVCTLIYEMVLKKSIHKDSQMRPKKICVFFCSHFGFLFSSVLKFLYLWNKECQRLNEMEWEWGTAEKKSIKHFCEDFIASTMGWSHKGIRLSNIRQLYRCNAVIEVILN